ncbi:MAG: hypothetical protein NVS9B9_11730 [Ktedonobacteraceae bacterium]
MLQVNGEFVENVTLETADALLNELNKNIETYGHVGNNGRGVETDGRPQGASLPYTTVPRANGI